MKGCHLMGVFFFFFFFLRVREREREEKRRGSFSPSLPDSFSLARPGKKQKLSYSNDEIAGQHRWMYWPDVNLNPRGFFTRSSRIPPPRLLPLLLLPSQSPLLALGALAGNSLADSTGVGLVDLHILMILSRA